MCCNTAFGLNGRGDQVDLGDQRELMTSEGNLNQRDLAVAGTRPFITNAAPAPNTQGDIENQYFLGGVKGKCGL